MYWGREDGTFTAAEIALTGISSGTHGDFNGDGVLDYVGGSSGSGASIGVYFGETSSVSSLGRMDLHSQEAAAGALEAISMTRARVTSELGALGAYMARFESAAVAVSAVRENSIAARGRLLDADVALESANLLRLQILQEGATAVLGQANNQPQIALLLLGTG